MMTTSSLPGGSLCIKWRGVPVLTWRGDGLAVQGLLTHYPDWAAATGQDPQAFADSAVAGLSTLADHAPEDERHDLAVAVLWLVMRLPYFGDEFPLGTWCSLTAIEVDFGEDGPPRISVSRRHAA